jgi:hypothetical protein
MDRIATKAKWIAATHSLDFRSSSGYVTQVIALPSAQGFEQRNSRSQKYFPQVLPIHDIPQPLGFVRSPCGGTPHPVASLQSAKTTNS